MEDDSDHYELDLEVPIFIEFKNSTCATNDLGAFCRMPLEADQFIGNYKGKIRKTVTHCSNQEYVWPILSSRQQPLFYIDATDPKDSNWLRFIRSTSDANKYNIICMQQNQQINYFTTKEIKLGDELCTYLPKKKRNKNRNNQTSYKLVELIDKKSFNTSSEQKQQQQQQEPKLEIIQETSSSYKNKKVVQPSVTKLKVFNDSPSSNNSTTKIEIKLFNSDQINQTKNKFLNIDFDLIINDKTKLKRRLIKCDLCSYLFICVPNKQLKDDLKFLQSHICSQHLETVENLLQADKKDFSDEVVVKETIDKMIQIIESNCINYFYKCNQSNCSNLKFKQKAELNKHLLEEHPNLVCRLKCFHCEEFISNIDEYINHLISDHKKIILNSLLLSEEMKNKFNGSNHISSATISSKNVNISNCKDYKNEFYFDWDYFYLNDMIEFNMNENINENNNSDNESESTSSNSNDEKANNNRQKNNNSKANISSKQIKPKSKGKNKQLQQQPLPLPPPPPPPPTTTTNGLNNEVENEDSNQILSTKTWTCQMCKKQFEQRIDLNKHQCVELNLKLLKKKKELRKKKWREAHWKRKIDLSYIETTSLAQLSQNIADNLSFCVDGTQEDLNSYSREVKDYLNTELGTESQIQMLLKCFPEFHDRIVSNSSSNRSSNNFNNNHIVDINLLRKANSYFLDCSYVQANNYSTINNAPFNCKTCKTKFLQLTDLIKHQYQVHNMRYKTSFDCYNNFDNLQKTDQITNWKSSDMLSRSPIGYLGCDPFAYLFNLYWDQKLEKHCQICDRLIRRSMFRKHFLHCEQYHRANSANNSNIINSSHDETDKELDNLNESTIVERDNDDLANSDEVEDNNEEEKEIIIFEPRTDRVKEENKEPNYQTENTLSNEIKIICTDLIDHMITFIENNLDKKEGENKQTIEEKKILDQEMETQLVNLEVNINTQSSMSEKINEEEMSNISPSTFSNDKKKRTKKTSCQLLIEYSTIAQSKTSTLKAPIVMPHVNDDSSLVKKSTRSSARSTTNQNFIKEEPVVKKEIEVRTRSQRLSSSTNEKSENEDFKPLAKVNNGIKTRKSSQESTSSINDSKVNKKPKQIQIKQELAPPLPSPPPPPPPPPQTNQITTRKRAAASAISLVEMLPQKRKYIRRTTKKDEENSDEQNQSKSETLVKENLDKKNADDDQSNNTLQNESISNLDETNKTQNPVNLNDLQPNNRKNSNKLNSTF